MTGLFSNKQIRCTHCGFEFTISVFGSAAKTVCPVCGEENQLLPPTQSDRRTNPPNDRPKEPAALADTEPILCTPEQCPLLTGEESANVIAEQLGLQRQNKRSRRRAILTWTVILQICVLLGTALFIATAQYMPEMGNIELSPSVGHGAASPPESPPQTVLLEHRPLGEQIRDYPAASGSTPSGPVTAFPDLTTSSPLPNAEIIGDPFALANENRFEISPFETPGETFLLPIRTPQDEIHDENQQTHHSPSGQDRGQEIGQDAASLDMPALLPSAETVRRPAATRKPVLSNADALLEKAKDTMETDPKNSIEHALQAAKLYEQQNQSLPDSMYWILGNAFTTLSWGEPLLESSPVIETMTLSPDGRYLLAQLRDYTVWIWDLHAAEGDRSGHLLDSGRGEYIKFLFTSNLRWVIGGQKDGTVRIWDMSLEKPSEATVVFAERISGLQDLQISPNGQWLAAFGNASANRLSGNKQKEDQLTATLCDPPPGVLCDTPNTIQQVHFQRERPGPFQARIQARNNSSSPPMGTNTVYVWNLRQLSSGVVPKAMTIPAAASPIQVVQFCPNSQRIAIGKKDATVRIYEITPRGIINEGIILKGHHLGITRIAFAPNGQWIATGSQDNTIRLWNLTNAKTVADSIVLDGHLGWISALTIDDSGSYIYSGSYDKTVRIWSVKEDRIATALQSLPIVLETGLGTICSLLLTKDNEKMIALGSEGGLGIYHLPSMANDFLDDGSMPTDNAEESFIPVVFRNGSLSINKCLLTSDEQILIFSYKHLTNPDNSGIRLWPLHYELFLQNLKL